MSPKQAKGIADARIAFPSTSGCCRPCAGVRSINGISSRRLRVASSFDSCSSSRSTPSPSTQAIPASKACSMIASSVGMVRPRTAIPNNVEAMRKAMFSTRRGSPRASSFGVHVLLAVYEARRPLCSCQKYLPFVFPTLIGRVVPREPQEGRQAATQ